MLRTILPKPYPRKLDPVHNLQVITSYFNPCGYRRLRDNYWRFREALSAPLNTIELLFPGQKPEIPDAHHVYSDTVLWHKESLLNILIKRLPEDVDGIAWIDADILFQNPHWYEQTKEQLSTWPVVQLFAKSMHLMPDGSLEPYKVSCGKLYQEKSKMWANFSVAHPGYAWAARAEWLRKVGLSDIHIIGGGDTFMMAGYTGVPVYQASRMNEAYFAAHQDWVSEVNSAVLYGLGYVPGVIHHLWHGSKENRRYIERYDDLTDFSPSHDLIRQQNGLWSWSDAANPNMVQNVANHFARRQEDDPYLHDRLVHGKDPTVGAIYPPQVAQVP